MDISILHICTHRSEIKAPPHVLFRRVLEMNEVFKGKDNWKRSVAGGNICLPNGTSGSKTRCPSAAGRVKFFHLFSKQFHSSGRRGAADGQWGS